jgi:hypothetical protein
MAVQKIIFPSNSFENHSKIMSLAEGLKSTTLQEITMKCFEISDLNLGNIELVDKLLLEG